MTPETDPGQIPAGATSLGNGAWFAPPPGPVTPGKGVRLPDIDLSKRLADAAWSDDAVRLAVGLGSVTQGGRPVRRRDLRARPEPGRVGSALRALAERIGVRR